MIYTILLITVRHNKTQESTMGAILWSPMFYNIDITF